MNYEVTKHDQELMRKENKGTILNLIRDLKPVSRSELARITRMSPTSVSRIVNELIENGLVQETEPVSGKVGRKALLLDTVPNSVYTVCAHLDPDITRIGIVNFDGEVIHERSIICDANQMTWQAFTDKICDEMQNMIVQSSCDPHKIIGAGIGVPGLIDTNQGIVLFSPQLQWKNIELGSFAQKHLGYPTLIENKVKTKALAENTYSLKENKRKVAFVHFGTGVGSTLIVDNHIFRGSTNSAGEIGHTTIEPNGRLCDCGRRGCLQTYITEKALLQDARTHKNVSCLQDIFDSAAHQEDWAVNLLNTLHTYMSMTICNVICMYNPDIVIIGGKLTEQPTNLLQILQRTVNEMIWSPFKDSYELKMAALGDKAGLLGMSILIVNRYLDIEL